LYDRIYIEPHYTLEVLSVGPFSKNLKDNIVYEGVLAFSRLTGKNFDYKIVIEKIYLWVLDWAVLVLIWQL
jgi:hypothetical protein